MRLELESIPFGENADHEPITLDLNCHPFDPMGAFLALDFATDGEYQLRLHITREKYGNVIIKFTPHDRIGKEFDPPFVAFDLKTGNILLDPGEYDPNAVAVILEPDPDPDGSVRVWDE